MITIIVPTDFSNNAYSALFYASRLFTEETCKIILVHSYEEELPHVINVMDPRKDKDITENLRSIIHSKLEVLKHKVIRDSEGIDLKIEFDYGEQSLPKIINNIILNQEVHFLVMGTKGASGLKEVFIGSQAVNVIKNIAPLPIFLIPKSSNFEGLENMMYATDFKKDTDHHNLTVLKKLIKAHHSRFHLAHIYNNSSVQSTIEVTYKHLKKELEGIEYTTYWISSERKMEQDLTQFCKEHHITLLILMYHRYGFLKRILKTSTVEKLSFHSDIPLLILPESV